MFKINVPLESGRNLTVTFDEDGVTTYTTENDRGQQVRFHDFDRTISAEFAWGDGSTAFLDADPDDYNGPDGLIGDWYFDNSHLLIDALIAQIERNAKKK